MNLDHLTEKELEQLIEYHNNLYWNLNIPEIEDDEFDLLIESLKKLNPNNHILKKVYSSIISKSKVKLRNIMLSLDKVYSTTELLEWCKKISRNNDEIFIISPKYDGVSADYYQEEKILVTRGNDGYGINISDKIYLVRAESNNQSKPLELFGHCHSIRGEIVIEKNIFKNYVQLNIKKRDNSSYKNTRNACAGILNRDDIIDIKLQPLTLIDYNSFIIEKTLKELKETDCTIIKEIEDHIKSDQFSYPVDGIVIRLKDINYGKSLGATEHHERHSIAYKFGNPKAESILLDVEWSIGKRVITPVGKIKSIYLDGSDIKNVSLHNAKFILDNNINIGDILIIEKAGSIIPHVYSIKKGENRCPIIIENCPICNSELLYEDPNLICSNLSCDGTVSRTILDSLLRLGMEGIGLPTVKDMIAILNVRNIIDILTLSKNNILNLPGFAQTSADNLFNEIQRIRNTPIDEYKILASLNIPGIGMGISREILKHISLIELLSSTYDNIINIPQMGRERTIILLSHVIKNKDLIYNLQKILKIKKQLSINKTNQTTICFTGKLPKPEKFYVQKAEEAGWIVKNNVDKELTYLITEDSNTTSVKGRKASELNIPFINTSKLLELLLNE